MVLSNNNYHPAVGYLRRSTDRQEQSIGDQRRTIEGYALNHGIEILNFYTDDAISGASTDGRTAFLKLIADAKLKSCPFKQVLVYDIKRFGRVDNDEAGYYRHQLKTRGIEIIYVSEGFNGDDTDDLLRPVKQWQARQELKDLSKVTIRGLLTRAEGGWWLGGVPPFGYDLAYYSRTNEYLCTVRFMSDGSRSILNEQGELVRAVPKGDSLQFTKRDRSRLVLSSPERIQLVKTMYDWYVVDGIGFKGIAKRLNQQETDRPFGNFRAPNFKDGWGQSSIAVILKNPIYTGDMVWNRTSFAKFHRISNHAAIPIRNFPGHSPLKNGEEDWIVTRDAHPAIITRTRYDESQKRREYTSKNGNGNTYNCGRGARSPFLLTGMIHCEQCGHNWIGYTIQKGRKRLDGSNVKTLYYCCNGYVTKGQKVCKRHLIGKEKLEQWVVEKIDAMLQKHFCTPEGIQNLRSMVERIAIEMTPQLGDEIDQVHNRIREIKTTTNNLIDNLTSANRDYVDVRLLELKRELAVLESKQLELASAGSNRIEAGRVIEQAIELAKNFKQVFESGTIEEKRLFIRAFVEKIQSDPVSSSFTADFVLIPGLKETVGMESVVETVIGNV